MPTILLAQEDSDALAEFSSLLLDFFPGTTIHPISDFQTLQATLDNGFHASALLTDLILSGEDRSGSLLLLAEQYPAVPFGILSRYDLSQSLPPAYPLPLLTADDHLPLALAELMEDFSGRHFGPYHLLSPAGPHPLGRLYWARHQQLSRDVQILVPPAGSARFPKGIRNFARLNHAGVYSLYESIPMEQRIFVAMEPATHPSLLHLESRGEKLDLRSASRLASTLGSVLAEMETSSIPARLLEAYDYTLSPKGTPRLRNPAAFPGTRETSFLENSTHLAEQLETFLPDDPKSRELLGILRDPGTSAFDLLKRTREFERQLAEVQEVHIREEEIEAARQAIRARIIRRWVIGTGSIASVGFALLWIFVLHHRFFLDVNATLGGEQIDVPAGQVVIEGKKVDVAAFSLDRHEVTIGEYERFLNDLPNQKLPDLLPANRPNARTTPAQFFPADWEEILNRARKKERYQGQVITRDTPVFNVDYLSAFAYAKWNKRNGKRGRLPKKEEWIWAASGKKALPYPWGTEENNPDINLGCNAEPKKVADPGYFRVLPAESNPRDVGPFGHFDLGGNLSEWINSTEVNKSDNASPPFIGGNYLDQVAVANSNAIRRLPSDHGDPRIGFRTAH